MLMIQGREGLAIWQAMSNQPPTEWPLYDSIIALFIVAIVWSMWVFLVAFTISALRRRRPFFQKNTAILRQDE